LLDGGRVLDMSRRLSWFLFVSICGGALACGGSDRPPGSGAEGGDGGAGEPSSFFDSDDPSGASGSPSPAGSDFGSGGATETSAGAPGASDAARAIEEADIVQIAGTRLYALSRYGGLSIVDVTDPDRLQLLGRLRLEAEPFEMYVRGDVVMVIVSDWGHYVEEAGEWRWVQSSEILAVDAADASAPAVIGEFAIPGRISDSRIVGNVFYAVTYEDGYCWRCDSGARTVIASLDVTNPRAVTEVDRLAFQDPNDSWSWGRRSVTVTPSRMYVGGPNAGWWGDTTAGSTIQVVDISDPGGELVLGATVEAAGEITSRWQMDEHEGVLRVVSQPPQWDLSLPPVIETFTVASSLSVTPLASLAMVLPRPEQLQSVRFDGARGYAITFERTDPLFVLDLADPADPKQMGELEIPGFVYHMEPRGDRLIGLGFDQGNPEGAITVSVFDVSDMSAPVMLDRVNFGGDWAYLPEDQNRIHKAFRIFDAEGLVLVPYSGYVYTDWETCGGSYRTGVQLVDLAGDDLTLRGSVPTRGEARRGLLHQQRLLTVSDDRIQSFDITDRDAPVSRSSVALAQRVAAMAAAGDHVVRVGHDWWTSGMELDVTTLEGVSSPGGLGLVSLDETGNECGYYYEPELFARPGGAFIVRRSYNYRSDGAQILLSSVDLSTPSAPRVAWSGPVSEGSESYYYYENLVRAGARTVLAGSALALQNRGGHWSWNGEWVSGDAWLDVVDVSNVAAPVTTRLDLPGSLGVGGLFVDGTTLLTSHYEPVEDSPGKIRFFVDFVDVSAPRAPRLAASVNVPGSLFAWDASSGRAITVDYRRQVETGITSQQCYERHGWQATFEPDVRTRWGGWTESTLGTCSVVRHSLKLVRIQDGIATLEDIVELDEGAAFGSSATGDGRVFLSLQDPYAYGYYDCWDYCGPGGSGSAKLTVLSGFGSGQLRVGTLELDGVGGIGGIVARGTRALVRTGWQGDLAVIDASNGVAPVVARTARVPGYVHHMTLSGSTALLSLGYDGAEAVSLD
jgi:hypothetical protein